MESPQNKIEHHRYHCAEYQGKQGFPAGDTAYLHLGTAGAGRVTQPANQCVEGHGGGHAQVGEHLPVIGEGIGDIPVQQAEGDAQHQPQGIPLGVEDQRSGTNQRGGQGKVIGLVEQHKGAHNEHHRTDPQCPFGFGEVFQFGRHGKTPEKKHPYAHLQRPNDVQTNAKALHYPVAVIIILLRRQHTTPKQRCQAEILGRRYLQKSPSGQRAERAFGCYESENQTLKVLSAISVFSWAMNSSRLMAVVSPLRLRTLMLPASTSLAPSTSI